MDRLYEPLQQRISGVVFTPDQFVAEHLTNYGNLHQRTPRFVVEPCHAADVVETIRFAREQRLSVATRGAGHSASAIGISDGGILLSMRSMRRILDVDVAANLAEVEAGVVWRDLVHHLKRWERYPRVLTNNLGVTVGGTLSVAGIGVASFLFGSQGDNVTEIDVVTGQGELVTCGPDDEPDLFWSAIAGLGQVGVITRAKLRLRQAKPMTRTYYLLYDDLRRFMHDAAMAMDSGRWDHLESWASPCPQGTRPVAGRRQVFASWFYPFHLTVEYDPAAPPDDAKLLEGLAPYKHLYTDDMPTVDFLERLLPIFELWKKAGTWEHAHPWMEVVLPWDTAADTIEQVLPDLPPGLLIGGHVLLWPAKGMTSRSRLFMRPPGEKLVGFGILPAVPAKFWPQVRPLLDNASRLSVLMGGKRYLSGWIDFDLDQWREHFGQQWEPFRAAKRRYDPDGILNPGFIPFEEGVKSGLLPGVPSQGRP